MRRRVREWERMAGAASLVAASVHGALAPAHFREWWGYGAFFVVATLAQTMLGLALLLDALETPSARAHRALYASGAVGTTLLVVLYVVTRTVGIPIFGPEAGVVEGVAPADVIAQAAQLAAIVILAGLAWRAPRDVTRSSTS